MSFLLCKQTTKLSKNWTKLCVISFWTGKPDKIKINVINKQYSDGGVKMIEHGKMGKWKLFFDLKLGRYGGEAVFLGNLDKIDTKNHFQISLHYFQDRAIWEPFRFLKACSPQKRMGSRFPKYSWFLFCNNSFSGLRGFQHFSRNKVKMQGKNKHGDPIFLLHFFNVLCMCINSAKFEKKLSSTSFSRELSYN